MSIEIRPASIADALRLAELTDVLGYPAALDVFSVRLARVLAQQDEEVLVAETSPGGIVGWIHAAEQSLLEADPRCEILGLVVDARLAAGRHQGTGRPAGALLAGDGEDAGRRPQREGLARQRQSAENWGRAVIAGQDQGY